MSDRGQLRVNFGRYVNSSRFRVQRLQIREGSFGIGMSVRCGGWFDLGELLCCPLSEW